MKILILNIVKQVSEIIWKKITLILHSNCNCKLWKQPLIKFALITFLLSCIATCLLLIENFFHPQKIDIPSNVS